MTTRATSAQLSIPAVYMRGGTSRALIFHQEHLPVDRQAWEAIFAAALGSPDPAGRQLDGLGGGISSLSKVAVVGPPTDPRADVDFLFGQVAIDGIRTSYRGNCGNISSAIGPYAVEEGLIAVSGDQASVRIHNVNTGKIIRADFAIRDGAPVVEGSFAIAGVAGTGAPIRLAFMDPGGATTGRLLPTGRSIDELNVAGRSIAVSLVDAANPVVFIAADSIGLLGNEAPSDIAANRLVMTQLEEVRVTAALAMGLVAQRQEAENAITNLPLVAVVSAPSSRAHIRVRMISAGMPHKATPLTGALCMAVAASIDNSLVAQLSTPRAPGSTYRIEHPGGVLEVDALVEDGYAREAVVYRTARRLMQGSVTIPRGVIQQ